MTPADRLVALAVLRRFHPDMCTPVQIGALVELLEVAVACDQAAEAEAVAALRAELDAGGADHG